MFREAAKKALDLSDFYNYSLLLKEAAKIDGAYDSQKVVDTDAYKKPTKVVFKIKQVNVNNTSQAEQARAIEEATYEQIRE